MRRIAAWLPLVVACKSYSGDDPASLDAGASSGSLAEAGAGDAGDVVLQGPACEPALGCINVPNGWSVVALTDPFTDVGAPGTAACPTDWVDHRRVRVNPRPANSQCSCTCGAPLSNPCLRDVTDTVEADTATTATCNSSRIINLDGTCRSISWPKASTHASGSINHNPATVACAATGALPAVIDDGEAWVCTSPPPGACPSGPGGCVTKPLGATVCYLHAGEADCPRPELARRVVYPDTGISDQRTCPCACSTAASQCKNPSITIYSNTMCTSNPKTIALDGACRAAPSLVFDAESYIYSATPNTDACVVNGATPSTIGELKLDPQTLCCE